MKNLLNYQSSEYDCGPTSLTNAIRFLFEREEVPPLLLKQIWAMGNDTFSDGGEMGKHGTSKASMRYMASWLRDFGKVCGFPIQAEFLELEETAVAPGSRSWECLEKGGCVVMRCVADHIPHYVLLTRLLPDGEVGLFDPYEEEPVFREPGRRVVRGKPRVMNRAVRYELLNREDEADYAMSALDTRENLLLWRTDKL